MRLPQALWDEIARHGEATFPDECCGALLGREEDGVRVVERLLPIDNVWDETERRRRFLIDGRTVMRVEKDAAREGLLSWATIIRIRTRRPGRPSSTASGRCPGTPI